MITLGLVFLSAKYNLKFEILYLGTFILDGCIIDGIVEIIKVIVNRGL